MSIELRIWSFALWGIKIDKHKYENHIKLKARLKAHDGHFEQGMTEYPDKVIFGFPPYFMMPDERLEEFTQRIADELNSTVDGSEYTRKDVDFYTDCGIQK